MSPFVRRSSIRILERYPQSPNPDTSSSHLPLRSTKLRFEFIQDQEKTRHHLQIDPNNESPLGSRSTSLESPEGPDRHDKNPSEEESSITFGLDISDHLWTRSITRIDRRHLLPSFKQVKHISTEREIHISHFYIYKDLQLFLLFFLHHSSKTTP